MSRTLSAPGHAPDPYAPNALRTLICATGCGLLLLLLWRTQTRIGPLATALFVKEGPFELLTFLLEMMSALWCFSTFYWLRRTDAMHRRAIPWLYAALGALLFLVAMEEINWGQTLIGFETPAEWAAINYQQETSIHNLVDKSVLTRAWKVIATLFGLSALALAFIRWRAPTSLLGTIAPHPALVPLALCVTYAGLRQHPEVVELMLSIFFAFYTYRIWTIARHASRPAREKPKEHPRSTTSLYTGKTVRIAIAVALLAFLASRFDWTESERIAAIASGPLLLGTFVAMVLTLVFSTWKWDWALRLHELRFDFRYLLRSLSIGFFFNNFLPTSIGGDAYRVLKTLPQDGYRSRALSAVIVERLAGVAALLILGTLGALRLAESSGFMRGFLYVMGGMTALAALTFLAIKSDWIRSATQRWHSVPAVKAIQHNLSLLRSHRKAWIALTAGSFAFQLLSIFIIFVLFNAIAANATPAQCAVIAAAVGIAAALPISINGLGVTEGTFVAVAVALNIDFDDALAVAFLRRGMALALAIPCGALWLSQGRKLSPHAGPATLARYFAAWKRTGMQGLLDELQPVAAHPPAVPLASSPISDVPLAISAATESDFSHANLLEYTHDAIVIWEMQGRGIRYWNQAAECLYEYSRKEALGNVIHSLLRTEVTGGVAAVESALARYGIWLGELQHTTRSGRKVQVEGRLSLMSQQNGRWLVLEVNRDITDRKAAEAARGRIEAQLAELRGLLGQTETLAGKTEK